MSRHPYRIGNETPNYLVDRIDTPYDLEMVEGEQILLDATHTYKMGLRADWIETVAGVGAAALLWNTADDAILWNDSAEIDWNA